MNALLIESGRGMLARITKGRGPTVTLRSTNISRMDVPANAHNLCEAPVRQTSRFVALVLLLPLFAGCSLWPDSLKYAAGDISYAGSGLVLEEAFADVDLIALLTDGGSATEFCIGMGESKKPEELPGVCVDKALAEFENSHVDPIASRKRNAIQERIIAASNARCELFKQWLHSKRSLVGFSLGTLTTATGTAGAVVASQEGSRILSGAAALFSGTRAEYNQELFSNLTTSVIVEGIDLRRRQVYEQIATKGQTKAYNVYNVSAAIKDAIYYNGECSVLAGIQVASDSIKTIQDPGLDTANRTLAKLLVTQSLLDAKDDGVELKEAVQNISSVSSISLAGTPNGVHTGSKNAAIDLVAESKQRVLESTQQFEILLGSIDNASIDNASRRLLVEQIAVKADTSIASIDTCIAAALAADNKVALAENGLKAAIAASDKSQAKIAANQSNVDSVKTGVLAVGNSVQSVARAFGAIANDSLAVVRKGDDGATTVATKLIEDFDTGKGCEPPKG